MEYLSSTQDDIVRTYDNMCGGIKVTGTNKNDQFNMIFDYTHDWYNNINVRENVSDKTVIKLLMKLCTNIHNLDSLYTEDDAGIDNVRFIYESKKYDTRHATMSFEAFKETYEEIYKELN
jgi:hypothetical protein